MPLRLTIWLCLLFPPLLIYGQQTVKAKPAGDPRDTIAKPAQVKSPRKAFLLSLLPGAGQFYNDKYWKIPVIYAAFAGLGYLVAYNNQNYQFYKNTEKTWIQNNPGQESSAYFIFVQTSKNDYLHSRDLDIIGMAAVYVLNLIDATVDAHLHTFDVSKDLSLEYKPDFTYSFQSNLPQARIRFILKF